jgi:hypothetical protein
MTHSPRFKGGIRHYHRAGSRLSSWEQWVDGEARHSRPGKNRLKLLVILCALLACGAIIAGLILGLSGG